MTEGVFLPDGTFLPLPKLASERFLKLCEQEVFALLLTEVTQHIERHQSEVIEKILRHCALWEESPARGPPVPQVSVES